MKTLFLIGATIALLGAGCAGGGAPAARPVAKNEAPAAPRAAEKASASECDTILRYHNYDPIAPGSTLGLPDDFPQPPENAELCGGWGTYHNKVSYHTTLTRDEIVNYYEEKLKLAGYSIRKEYLYPLIFSSSEIEGDINFDSYREEYYFRFTFPYDGLNAPKNRAPVACSDLRLSDSPEYVRKNLNPLPVPPPEGMELCGRSSSIFYAGNTPVDAIVQYFVTALKKENYSTTVRSGRNDAVIINIPANFYNYTSIYLPHDRGIIEISGIIK